MKVALIYNKDISGVINQFGMQNKEFYSEETVNRVAACIEKAGHNIAIFDGNMYIIDRLQNFMPRVMEGEKMGMVFNMAYGIQGESRYTHIPSMLEMLGLPYVGSSPAGHALALDKVMTKIIWQNHKLPTPDFWVFNSGNDDFSEVRYPVIVKPKMESVSFGLKVVYEEKGLKEAVEFIVNEFQQQALAEQFIRGKEFCVGLIGNNPVETFPVLEIDLEGDPDGIQTVDNKKGNPREKICPANISNELAGKMTKFSIEAFRALNLRDFSRVDLRVDENENIYLLEINSMASLGPTGSYNIAARAAGYDFCSLVNKMLDVAAIRYFSTSNGSSSKESAKKISVQSKLRTFLRSRQDNTENFLKRIVNFNSHVRNIEGINLLSGYIKSELAQLGFTSEIYPQLEVGNQYYFSNTHSESLDYFIVLATDNVVKLQEHENFGASEQKLFGTGIWEKKGGIAILLSALQALRFIKTLKKLKIGIFLATDSATGGKYSRSIISSKAGSSKIVLGMTGGNLEGGIITSRSGSASYSYALKLTDHSDSANVALAAQVFNKTLAAIVGSSTNDPEDVIAPYEVEFKSNIFKVFAYGSALISIRFNSPDKFPGIDEKIRKFTALKKNEKKILQSHLEGGLKRPPLTENENSGNLFENIRQIADLIDIRVSKEHRWSSSALYDINPQATMADGMGPVGAFDNNTEFILRHSLIDRALLLTMLLKDGVR